MKTYDELYNDGEFIAWVDLSTYCNAACPQCHRTNTKGLDKVDWLPLIQWDLNTFKKAFPVSTLPSYEKFTFCGTFGDPIMNKDIFEIVEYIVKHSACKIMINTNGSIRDEQWWWNLGMLAKDRLRVIFAVDGINEEMHSRYRQKTSLKKVIENMEALATTPANIDGCTIVFKHNEDYIHEIENMARRAGATRYFTISSNRFKQNNIFTFIDEDDNIGTLEKSTKYG